MSEQLTGDYVLQMAERIERNGAEFYGLAAVRDLGPARAVFTALAAAEARHEQRFRDLRARLATAPAGPLDPNGEVAAFVRGLLAGKFFDPTANPASFFTGSETFRNLLLTAIGLERESIVFYEGLKALVTEKEHRDVIDLILHEEVGHVTTLGRQLAALDEAP